MISLSKGTPIALNTAGKYKNEIVYVNKDEDAEIDPWASPKYIINTVLTQDNAFIKLTRKTSHSRKEQLLELLNDPEFDPYGKDIEAFDKFPGLDELYKSTVEILKRIYAKEIFIPDAKLQPIIPDNEHSCWLIAGQSGSGKSYFAADLLRQMRKKDPKKKIYIVSYLDEDKAYDFLGENGGEAIIRIPCKGDEGIENFVGVETIVNIQGANGKTKKAKQMSEPLVKTDQFEDSVIVFDDIEAIPDSSINKGVHLFQKACLQTLRHQRGTTINIAHELQNWKKTKELLTEATYIVGFVNSNPIQMKKFFKTQYGMSDPEVKKIMTLGEKSRWICLCRKIPNYILSEKSALIIN